MEVDTSIAEADVGRLTPGLTATFTVDATPRGCSTARSVRSAAAAGRPELVTYNAVVDVDNPDLALKPA